MKLKRRLDGVHHVAAQIQIFTKLQGIIDGKNLQGIINTEMITSKEQTRKRANLGSEQEIILRKEKMAYKWKWQICSTNKTKKTSIFWKQQENKK